MRRREFLVGAAIGAAAEPFRGGITAGLALEHRWNPGHSSPRATRLSVARPPSTHYRTSLTEEVPGFGQGGVRDLLKRVTYDRGLCKTPGTAKFGSEPPVDVVIPTIGLIAPRK